MHPAELGIVVLILAAWAGAVAAFLHKWRRLRIVPPRQLRYKHATPKNLDAVQVASIIIIIQLARAGTNNSTTKQ